MDNLEQQCEDALFELCDAREQCPFKCAAEFRKCIQLTNEIQILRKCNPTVNRRRNDGKVVKKFDEVENAYNDRLKIMTNVAQKSNVIDNIVEQRIHFNGDFNKKEACFKQLDFKLKTITNALSNLKAVMDQVEREETCEINILLKS